MKSQGPKVGRHLFAFVLAVVLGAGWWALEAPPQEPAKTASDSHASNEQQVQAASALASRRSASPTVVDGQHASAIAQRSQAEALQPVEPVTPGAVEPPVVQVAIPQVVTDEAALARSGVRDTTIVVNDPDDPSSTLTLKPFQ